MLRSASDETSDRLGGFANFVVSLSATALCGFDDTVRQVLVEQFERERLQRLRGRGDLGQDVNTVLVLLHHSLQTTDLTLDPPQPLQVSIPFGCISMCRWAAHASEHTPRGYLKQVAVYDQVRRVRMFGA